MFLPIIYVAFLFCDICHSSDIDNYIDNDTPPIFPSTYIIKAILHIPYSEIDEPFMAWYDSDAKLSRVDYYGGMVKTFQLENVKPFGKMLKVAPVTTEISLNVNTCLELNGTSEMIITKQSVVPDMTNYKFLGNEIIESTNVEKWQYVESIGNKFTKYTMYIRYEESKILNFKIPVPVKFVMKGRNVIFGAHFDHYWIEYFSFSDEKPNPSVFTVPDMKCQSFPGPGLNHYYTFNPMKEFIDCDHKFINLSFNNFQKLHNKQYNNSDEELYRKEIFKHNLRFIHSRNRANLGYSLSVNHLADKTKAELRYLRGRQYTPGYNGGQEFVYDIKKEIKSIPSTFDWRIYGAVTPVKDQSVCGSCWSFGTTGAIEGEFFVYSKTLIRLSQQALIDCSWGFGNNGCDGGEDFRSYQWMMKHGGIPMEEDYGPYYGQDGYCHLNNTKLTARIKGYVNVTSGNENALKIALLKHGPISVAIDASPLSFSFYSNGVYYDETCKNSLEQLDHAVLLVGYGTLGIQKYWLIKNSWSNYWGNDGYILIAISNNTCGVMTAPTYVLF